MKKTSTTNEPGQAVGLGFWLRWTMANTVGWAIGGAAISLLNTVALGISIWIFLILLGLLSALFHFLFNALGISLLNSSSNQSLASETGDMIFVSMIVGAVMGSVFGVLLSLLPALSQQRVLNDYGFMRRSLSDTVWLFRSASGGFLGGAVAGAIYGLVAPLRGFDTASLAPVYGVTVEPSLVGALVLVVAGTVLSAAVGRKQERLLEELGCPVKHFALVSALAAATGWSVSSAFAMTFIRSLGWVPYEHSVQEITSTIIVTAVAGTVYGISTGLWLQRQVKGQVLGVVPRYFPFRSFLVVSLILAGVLYYQTSQACGWLDMWQQKSGCLQLIHRHPDDVDKLILSPDGTLLASFEYYSNDGVPVIEVDSGRLRYRIKPLEGAVNSLAFSHDAALIALGLNNGAIQLWRTGDSKQETAISTGANVPVTALAFSPDGSLLASTSERSPHSIYLWRVNDGELHMVLAKDSGSTKVLAFSPDGRILASAGEAGTELWNVSDASRIRMRQNAVEGTSTNAWEIGANVLAFSPDGSMLASGGDEWALFARLDGTRLLTLPVKGTVKAISFSADSKVLTLFTTAYGSSQKIQQYSLNAKLLGEQNLPDISQLEKTPSAVMVSSKSLLAFSAGQGRVAIWDVDRRRAVEVGSE